MFGLGMALKEILSRLFNSFILKILDLYLETWLWSRQICAEKALHGGVDIWDYAKTYTFNNFVVFFQFFTIIIILLFLLVYIINTIIFITQINIVIIFIIIIYYYHVLLLLLY